MNSCIKFGAELIIGSNVCDRFNGCPWIFNISSDGMFPTMFRSYSPVTSYNFKSFNRSIWMIIFIVAVFRYIPLISSSSSCVWVSKNRSTLTDFLSMMIDKVLSLMLSNPTAISFQSSELFTWQVTFSSFRNNLVTKMCLIEFRFTASMSSDVKCWRIEVFSFNNSIVWSSGPGETENVFH